MGLYSRTVKRWKPLGRKEADKLVLQLKQALRSAKMESANFEGMSSGIDPKENKTEFIKEETRLYRQSWIVHPLEKVLEQLIKQYDL